MATLKKGGGKTRVCYFYDSDVRTAAARFQRLSRDFFRATPSSAVLTEAFCAKPLLLRSGLHMGIGGAAQWG